MMSKQCRCNIMTSLRHWYNIVFSCVPTERERERERGGGGGNVQLFIWKHDTFVTLSWGSLKYDKGLI